MLFDAGEYSGAYYLAGYAVECALKACIAKRVQKYDFPDKNVRKVFIHNLDELVVLAELSTQRPEARDTNLRFAAAWEVVRQWTEDSRYAAKSKGDAEAIIDAIAQRKDGVLAWIKRYW